MPIYVDTIICESVRPEANGKMSLLGVFGDSILVPQIPTQLATLAILQRWKPSPGEEAGTAVPISLEVRIPGNQPLRLPEHPLIIPTGPKPQMTVVLQVQGFPITQEGDCQVVTFIRGEQVHVYEFYVGHPAPGQQHLIGFR